MQQNHKEILFSHKEMRSIIQFQHEYYNDNNIHAYLSKCIGIIDGVLVSCLGDDYLSSKSYYFNYNNILEVIDADKKQKESSFNYIDAIVKAGENMMRQNQLVSISRALFDTSISGVLLYEGSTPEALYINDIKKFDLSALNFSSPIFFKEKATESDILIAQSKIIKDDIYINAFSGFSKSLHLPTDDRMERVLVIYKLIYEQIIQQHCETKPFYVYFIRPVTLHSVYSGVLLLVLLRPLADDEYASLSSILTVILSEKATVKSKNEEWQKISEMRAHSLHHQISARKQITSEIEFLFNEVIKNRDKNTLEYESRFFELLASMKSIDNYIANVDNLQFAVQKVERKYKNWCSLEDKDPNKEFLRIKDFDLAAMLVRHIKALQYALGLLAFDAQQQERVANVLNKLIEKIEINLFGLRLNAVEKLLDVVIQDILKNVVKYTNAENPQITIELRNFDANWVEPEVRRKLVAGVAYKALVFTNNEPIREEKNYRFMINPSDAEENSFSKTTNLGIRSIHTLLQYDGISQSQTTPDKETPYWIYAPAMECLLQDHYTKTLLIFPKEDLI